MTTPVDDTSSHPGRKPDRKPLTRAAEQSVRPPFWTQLPFVRKLARKALERALAKVEFGDLRVRLPDGTVVAHSAAKPGPSAELDFLSWNALWRLKIAGSIGFAEGYIAGEWTSPDLAGLIELFALNGRGFSQAVDGGRIMALAHRLFHLLRANSKPGSRRNIEFHYDLGNSFYRSWLDAQMVYSSAIYADAGESLEAAQENKLSHIVGLLGVHEGDEVLEVGFGWGALALKIARAGARKIKGITLSNEQFAHARALIAREEAAERIDFEIRDYRDVGGTFDRIVSIEMFEAVGRQYWPVYFNMIKERLKQHGTAVLQIITIADDRFEDYARSADFIQRYIFPGGLLPSKAELDKAIGRAGLRLAKAEHFGLSYARTLADWHSRFLEAWPHIEPMGYSLPFRRMWEYYLSYCEGGFRSGAIDVGLYVLKHTDA